MSTKKWRRLEVGEVVQAGDMYNNKSNRGQSINPPALGYIPANESIGRTVTSSDSGWYIREVEEPATGKLTPEQAFAHVKALWPCAERLRLTTTGITWAYEADGVPYKALRYVEIDWPKGVTEWPLQPKWETPVLPFDWGKECEFSDDGDAFEQSTLSQYAKNDESDKYVWCSASRYYAFCRIDRNRYPVPLPGAPESAQ